MQIRLTLALALTAGMLSTAAFAQSSEEQQACMDDAFRVCGAFIPDRGRVTTCMVENKSKLSSACQMVMNKYAPASTVRTAATTQAAPVHAARNAARPGKPLSLTPR